MMDFSDYVPLPAVSVPVSSVVLPVAAASHGLFPLCLHPIAPPSSSRSRRSRQVVARARSTALVVNDVIRSLNTIYFDCPSVDYVDRMELPSYYYSSASSPILSHQRLLSHIHATVSIFITSSRRAGLVPTTGASPAISGRGTSGLESGRCFNRLLGISHSSSPPPVRDLFLFDDRLPAAATSVLPQGVSSAFEEPPVSTSTMYAIVDEAASAPSVPSAYASTALGVVKLKAEMVSLPAILNRVPILSLLPSDIARVYTSPASLLLHPSLVAQRIADANLRDPYVWADAGEYVKLVKRMLVLSMLEFTNSPICVNGIFGVPKPDTQIRLILDARPANCWFVDPPHVSLPSPSHIARLVVPPGKPVWVAKSDLSNFYHQLVLPEWMRAYFCLPCLSSMEVATLSADPDLPLSVLKALEGPGPFYPACVTLPMGFSHAVFLAQCVHEHVLYSSMALSPADNILNITRPAFDRCIHSLYIDDNILMAPSESECERALSRSLAAYASVSVPVHPDKVVRPTTDPVSVIGVEVNGSLGTVSLAPLRHSALVTATVSLLRQPMVVGRSLAVIAGGWTWVMLLCRPSLSVMKHVYRFIDRHMEHPHRLWLSVRRELLLLMAIAPLLHVQLWRPFASDIVATDASSQAAGVVSSVASDPLLASLWCQGSGHSPSLLSLTARQIDPSPAASVLLQQPSVQFASIQLVTSALLSLLSTTSWSTIISSPWRREAHINELELHSVLLAIRWALSQPVFSNSRMCLLTDSSVVFYGLQKGRSSAPALLSLFRRYAALVLAGGLSIMPVWIPSSANPADAPSRNICKGWRVASSPYV